MTSLILDESISLVCSESHDKIANSLSRMCLPAKLDPSDSDFIIVTVPPTRPDVMHMADIVEDVAIAHGYDKSPKPCLRPTLPGNRCS